MTMKGNDSVTTDRHIPEQVSYFSYLSHNITFKYNDDVNRKFTISVYG